MTLTLVDSAVPDAPSVERVYASFPRRINAMILDLIIVVGTCTFVVLVAGVLPFSSAGRIGVLLVLGILLFYDPVLVAVRGGTIGHFRMNMRVVDEHSNARIPFLRAFGRYWIKAVLGLLSFFAMLVTRRHQALHDLATKSAVVIYDFSVAAPGHFVLERPADFNATPVSVRRRVAVIILYLVLSFLTLSIATGIFISETCLNADVCGPVENAVFTVSGLVMLVTFGGVAVAGWKGLLPGAR